MATASHGPLTLSVLPGTYAVCRLTPEAAVPAWSSLGLLSAVIRTPDELSIVCAEEAVPPGVRAEGGWAALRVAGPLAFTVTGILASLSAALAEAGVPLFALSTFNTDYLLVPSAQFSTARAALEASGHRVTRPA